MTAFAGESQARNKYTFYAEKAKEQGLDQIAELFLETARNEQEHAKLWSKEEGFNKLAFQFEAVANIEKRHEERYLALLANVENSKVFKKDEKVVWQCAICGYRVESEVAPGVCPVCGYPQAVFAKASDNY